MSDSLPRRDFLKAATCAAGGLYLQGTPGQGAEAPADPGLTSRENQKEGHPDWQLTRVRLDSAKGFRSPFIEGYASRQSVPVGGRISIHVSTRPAERFRLEIFRMGYYGGAGARKMRELGPFPGRTQPDPQEGPGRLRACEWEPAVELEIPEDWPSGVYLGRLTTLPEGDAPYWQSYVIFIVTDNRPADILFQCSDNTWQAYNRWPDNFSLYTSPTGNLNSDAHVSFDRPYGKYSQIFDHPLSIGSGEFLLWEYPLCYWLERQGYDVTYASNSDLVTPDRALKCRSFISVGHDEYWDLRQYQSVRRLIDEGVNALFLCGNSICFVSPFADSGDGRPCRSIHRAGRYGGMTDLEKTAYPTMGPFPITDAPNENLLMGARTITPFNGGGDWICTRPEHWIFEGTGMKQGEAIPGLVGWEFHGDPADLPGLEVIAEGTAWSGGVHPAHWTATVHPGPRDNWVFNASTIFWAQGLDSPPGHILPWSHWSRPHGPDPRVQQITRNFLKRVLG